MNLLICLLTLIQFSCGPSPSKELEVPLKLELTTNKIVYKNGEEIILKLKLWNPSHETQWIVNRVEDERYPLSELVCEFSDESSISFLPIIGCGGYKGISKEDIVAVAPGEYQELIIEKYSTMGNGVENKLFLHSSKKGKQKVKLNFRYSTLTENISDYITKGLMWEYESDFETKEYQVTLETKLRKLAKVDITSNTIEIELNN